MKNKSLCSSYEFRQIIVQINLLKNKMKNTLTNFTAARTILVFFKLFAKANFIRDPVWNENQNLIEIARDKLKIFHLLRSCKSV